MLKKTLENILKNHAISSLNIYADILNKSWPGLMIPKSPEFGDYSCSIAMSLSKALKKNPKEIAQLIVHSLASEKLIEKIRVDGPGFINIFVNKKYFSSLASEIISRQASYGISESKNSERVLLEFVSANPTGPLHLGHARGAYVGDAVARILQAAGKEVTKEFYVNDAGNQVKVLARTVFKRYRELLGEKITILEGEYPSLDLIDIAKKLLEKYGDVLLTKDVKESEQIAMQFAIQYNLELIRSTLAEMDISFDNFYNESSLHDKGKLKEIVAKYKDMGAVYEAEEAIGKEDSVRRKESKAFKYSHLQKGGTFLKTSDFGDEEDRIIQRHDGSFVYLTADLAYHYEKYLRGFDKMIDVFGADHAGHIPRLYAGMEALGLPKSKLNFIAVQMMKLLQNGEELRFSKRSGKIYAISDLIEEIGKDATRFLFLMRAPTSQFDLDIKILKEKNSDNPVFYLQYAHARMCSILAKSDSSDLNLGDINIDNFLPEERQLFVLSAEYPLIINDAATNLEPHRLVNYLGDLAKTFHSYFTKYRDSEKIISDDKNTTNMRVTLVFILRQVIKNGLGLLGISAPESMNNL